MLTDIIKNKWKDIDNDILQYLKLIIADNKFQKIIDFGCGDGRYLQLLELSLSYKLNYFGIDYNIDQASINHSLLNSKITLIEKDTEEYFTFVKDNNCIDFVYSSFVLHHLDNLEIGIKEMLTFLTPKKGNLYIVDFEDIVMINVESQLESVIESEKNRIIKEHTVEKTINDCSGTILSKKIKWYDLTWVSECRLENKLKVALYHLIAQKQ